MAAVRKRAGRKSVGYVPVYGSPREIKEELAARALQRRIKRARADYKRTGGIPYVPRGNEKGRG